MGHHMQTFLSLSAEEALNYLPDAVLILDETGAIIFCNRAFGDLLGYASEELMGKAVTAYLENTDIFASCMADIRSMGYCSDQETTFRHRGGHPIPTIKSVCMIENGQHPMIFVNIRDVSEIDALNKQLRRAERKAQQSAEQLTSLVSTKEAELHAARLQLDKVLSSINEIIWYIDDSNLTVQYVSDAVEKIFGIAKEEFTANPHLWHERVYPEDQERVRGFFLNLQPGAAQAIDFRIQRPDGQIRWLNNRVVHHEGLNFFIGVTIDITETKKVQDTIEHMAYHDTLTHLPNRAYLTKEIERLLARSAIIHQELAVMFLDLDNFKYINDTMGHEVGDEVLIEVAERLVSVLNPKAVCTRFGGDEFIILLGDVHDHSDIEHLVSALIKTFRHPFTIREHEFFISCSIGIALYPDHADTSSDLIKHADTAMYTAKKTGKNRFVYYSQEMDTPVNDFLRVENLIREGMLKRQFLLHFQPLVESSSQQPVGFEALMRFQHPEAGMISPAEFIPIAEATGDILQLSRFLIAEACRFIKVINAATGSEYYISLNISSRQFLEAEFAKKFLQTLYRHDVPAHFITIEVTESVIMENIDVAISELSKLRKAGVRIALDDFGTGYSCFEYLAKLPIDTIKIDKSFVIDLFESETNRHIIDAITKLAHAMGQKVTAEGVESSHHASYLQAHDIDTLQGFAIARPQEGSAILKEITENQGVYDLSLFRSRFETLYLL